jgi:hypothetical protein
MNTDSNTFLEIDITKLRDVTFHKTVILIIYRTSYSERPRFESESSGQFNPSKVFRGSWRFRDGRLHKPNH